MLTFGRNVQVALAEAESKYEQAMASNAQLEKENAKLITDSEVLQDYARELEEQHLEVEFLDSVHLCTEQHI